MAKNSAWNFTIKNCFFDAASIAKTSDKERWVYSGYGIAFDGKGEGSFVDESTMNALIFDVDNNSSSHTDNCKNNFLILGESPAFGINGSFGPSGFWFSSKVWY